MTWNICIVLNIDLFPPQYIPQIIDLSIFDDDTDVNDYDNDEQFLHLYALEFYNHVEFQSIWNNNNNTFYVMRKIQVA